MVPSRAVLSTGLSVFRTWQLASLSVSNFRLKDGHCEMFYDVASEVTYCFCSRLGIRTSQKAKFKSKVNKTPPIDGEVAKLYCKGPCLQEWLSNFWPSLPTLYSVIY